MKEALFLTGSALRLLELAAAVYNDRYYKDRSSQIGIWSKLVRDDRTCFSLPGISSRIVQLFIFLYIRSKHIFNTNVVHNQLWSSYSG